MNGWITRSPVSAYLFDLDGTVYLGPRLIPGADAAIAGLRAAGRHVAFLSNKPISTCQEYADKLTGLGIPTSVDAILNSSVAIAMHLRERAPDARLYVVGEAPLLDELRAAGLTVADRWEQADTVVASWDRGVTYDRLDGAVQLLLRGARFVATNPDVCCPTEDGQVPDCGAFIAFLEAASGRRVGAVAGKPSPLMVEVMLGRLGVAPARALMVGDRLETDIGVGKAAGCATALVLTGAATREAALAWPQRPDYILGSVAELAPPPG